MENTKLVTDWPNWRGDPDMPAQRITWLLEAIGDQTRVTLIHEPFERTTDLCDYPQGWAHFLSQLKAQVEAPLEPTRSRIDAVQVFHFPRSLNVMSKHAWIWCGLVAGAALSLPAAAGYRGSDVSVEVIDEQGSAFQQVPVKHTGGAYRAYLQADRGARYRIRVSNPTGSRIGVVVAVDGRNIINGAQSQLAKGEPMYVLAAGTTARSIRAGARASPTCTSSISPNGRIRTRKPSGTAPRAASLPWRSIRRRSPPG